MIITTAKAMGKVGGRNLINFGKFMVQQIHQRFLPPKFPSIQYIAIYLFLSMQGMHMICMHTTLYSDCSIPLTLPKICPSWGTKDKMDRYKNGETEKIVVTMSG